jgi:enoyl-CoA hydratase/carnithine racemase
MTDKLLLEIDGDIARTILNRREKMNSIDMELLDDWMDALDEVEAANVKMLTVQGAGGILSAGADLSKTNSAIEAGDREWIADFLSRIHVVTGRLESLSIPTLAAVEGYALAGGLEILLACDMAIASTNARIGDQHANYGLVAGGGGTQRIVEAISKRRANDLMFTGRHIDGATAENWGLVSRAFDPDEFDEALSNLEAELASKSRDAATLTKELMTVARETDRDVGYELEWRRVTDHNFGEDVREGLEAFKERRDPDF